MLNAAGESVAVEPIAFDDLGDDEILVRLAASGVCHTDLHVKITNGWGMAFPILLGHEGAGVVEHVGRAVTSVRPDDRVVISWRVPCGACAICRRGDPVLCQTQRVAQPRARRARAGGPLDYAFEVVGLPATVAQAVGMVGYGGTVVIVGVPPTDSTVTLPLARGGLFNKKVTLTSCSGGDMVPSEFFPRLMSWYLDGTLRLDEMVTREIGLDDVEDAFAAMTSGTVIRSVIRL